MRSVGTNEKPKPFVWQGRSAVGKEIAVIGGGAAGMMAAYAAAGSGCSVTLYEKNEKLGKKLYITGKGRCNVTNACKREVLFENVVRNPRFLYSAFSGFDNQDAMAFWEGEGCPLKIERGDRVFPVSDHASDIIRALEEALVKKGVRIRLQTGVKRILTTPDAKKVTGLCLLDKTEVRADAVIVAAGGLSYPSTGSAGDGFDMARKLSHTVTPCGPALVPFEVAEKWCAALQGLALKNVGVSLEVAGQEVYNGFGEMLFTHFGVSGPLILSASSFYGEALEKWRRKNEKRLQEAAAAKQPVMPAVRLYVNLKPALQEKQLDDRIVRDFAQNQNRDFKNALGGLFPAKLIPVMIALSGIAPEKKVHEVTKQERKNFGKLIQRLPLTVTNTRGFSEAVITKGGICVREVNPSTMESRKVRGLYFAGEILDVDALTGGFNLQIAWSTGYLAGKSAASGNGEEMNYSIAIDGPAGAGKSTIAKKIAKRMGCIYVDTGAMYRAMALLMIRHKIAAADSEEISRQCRKADITIRYEGGEQVVFLNGENVNGQIRTEEVGRMASVVAKMQDVRAKLLELQRKLAKSSDVVMDGRDIGTCVLPDATVKIYLTASADVRAKRRYEELQEKGIRCDYETIRADIVERDRQDMNREISPLKQAEDAVLVDSSLLTADEVTEKIIAVCSQKGVGGK